MAGAGCSPSSWPPWRCGEALSAAVRAIAGAELVRAAAAVVLVQLRVELGHLAQLADVQPASSSAAWRSWPSRKAAQRARAAGAGVLAELVAALASWRP